MMLNWTRTANYPVITAAVVSSTEDASSSTVTTKYLLTQRSILAYLADNPVQDDDRLWAVPLRIATPTGIHSVLFNTRDCEWSYTCPRNLITSSSSSSSLSYPPVKFNAGAASFVRIHYADDSILQPVIATIKESAYFDSSIASTGSDGGVKPVLYLPAEDRLGVLSDLVAMNKGGKAPLSQVIIAMKSYADETNTAVLRTLSETIQGITALYSKHKGIAKLKRALLPALNDVYAKLGWGDEAKDDKGILSLFASYLKFYHLSPVFHLVLFNTHICTQLLFLLPSPPLTPYSLIYIDDYRLAKRAYVLSALASLSHTDVRDKAAAIFQTLLNTNRTILEREGLVSRDGIPVSIDPSTVDSRLNTVIKSFGASDRGVGPAYDATSVPPDYRSIIYRGAIQDAYDRAAENREDIEAVSARLFFTFIALHNHCNQTEEKLRLLSALGRIRGSVWQMRGITFVQSPWVRMQDKASALLALDNETVWEYMVANWDQVLKQFREGHAVIVTPLIVGILRGFKTEEKLTEVHR